MLGEGLFVGEVTDGDDDKDGEFVTSQAVDREIEAGYKSVHPSVKIIVLPARREYCGGFSQLTSKSK